MMIRVSPKGGTAPEPIPDITATATWADARAMAVAWHDAQLYADVAAWEAAGLFESGNVHAFWKMWQGPKSEQMLNKAHRPKSRASFVFNQPGGWGFFRQ